MIKQEILELLSHSEQEAIYSFIADYAAKENDFYVKIKEVLLPDEDDEEEFDMDYYRELAEDCYEYDEPYDHRRRYGSYYDHREAASVTASNLDKVIDDAAFYAGQGKYATAAGMAMAVAESIPEKYESLYDSEGELYSSFRRAIELLCNIIKNESASFFCKNEVYNWSKKEVVKPVYYDYDFSEIRTINECCHDRLGETDEVLAEIENQINTASSEWRKSKAVMRKIHFMQSRNLNVEDVVQKHLDLNEVRKFMFNRLKDAGNLDEALCLAKQGVAIAQQKENGTEIEWQKEMFDIYLAQGDTNNLLPMAKNLLENAGGRYPKEVFYNALKEFTPKADWQETLERILYGFEQKQQFTDFAARIMQEHRLWKRLFDYCKKGSISVMTAYESDLKPHFEANILDYYRDWVERRALITDWHAYEDVADYLKRMRTFSGGDKIVNQLLEKYRSTYKRRKSMIAALKDV